MDEKKLFLTILAPDDKVKFLVMSVEEPANADANGLKASLDKSLSNLNLSVPCGHCEIVVCTDGAPVNVAMYLFVKEEVGEHCILTLCPAHKIDLAIWCI